MGAPWPLLLHARVRVPELPRGWKDPEGRTLAPDDLTAFVTLYGPRPLSLSFLITKTPGFGHTIGSKLKNGAESKAIKRNSLVTD